jgi:hypothetical protein
MSSITLSTVRSATIVTLPHVAEPPPTTPHRVLTTDTRPAHSCGWPTFAVDPRWAFVGASGSALEKLDALFASTQPAQDSRYSADAS